MRGYVIIEVYGFSVERFVNLCMKKGISLWNIARETNKLVMYVSLTEMKDLEACIRKTGCQVKIRKEIGVPFILRRYRKRKIFIVGALITCLVLYILSSVVWQINVYGNERYSTHDIVTMLKGYGVDIGTFKFRVKCKEIEDTILLEHPNIAWVSLEMKGSNLIVNITETVETPDLIEQNKKPVDIIANKDCVVHYVVTRAGKAAVKRGDVVLKGDTLVSGALEILNDDQTIRYQYVHADADIQGKVYYAIDDQIRLDYIEKNFTQKKKHDFYFVIGNRGFKFFRPIKYFEHSDELITESRFSFFNFFTFGFKKVTYHEYLPVKKRYSEKEAKDILARRINWAMKNRFEEDEEIIDKEIVYTISEKIIKAKMNITVIEEIGVTKEIEERVEEWTEEENQ